MLCDGVAHHAALPQTVLTAGRAAALIIHQCRALWHPLLEATHEAERGCPQHSAAASAAKSSEVTPDVCRAGRH